MRYAETRGLYVGVPMTIQGIIDHSGEVAAVRVVGTDDGEADSWGYRDKQIAQFAEILKAADSFERTDSGPT